MFQDARNVHGPSASHLLMLGDVIQFAGTMDVLGDDKGASLSNLSAALDAYIRANQTANKKLRKRFVQLKQDAQLKLPDAIQDRAEGASLQLPDAQHRALQSALGDFVARQQLDARVAPHDRLLFDKLDKILAEPLKVEIQKALSQKFCDGCLFKAKGLSEGPKVCRKLLADAVEEFCAKQGSSSLTSFELLDAAVDCYCSEKFRTE